MPEPFLSVPKDPSNLGIWISSVSRGRVPHPSHSVIVRWVGSDKACLASPRGSGGLQASEKNTL
jgi:hypothetical protein